MPPLRTALCIVAPWLILLLACSDAAVAPAGTDAPSRSDVSAVAPVTPVARPASVPDAAEAVEETRTLGRIERPAPGQTGAIDTRRLEEASCRNGVIVFRTSQESIYAARSCDGFWDAETAKAFVDQEIAMVLEVTGERFRILIETLEGAQAQFPAGGIWVE